MNRKYVIINKRRFFTFIIISLLMIIILISSIVFLSRAHSQELISYKEYRVGKGDTLWRISNYYSDNSHMDTRQFIYEIRKLNGMKTSAIYEDEIIKIPILK